MWNDNALASESNEAFLLKSVEHLRDAQARLAKHSGECDHAAGYLLLAAVIDEVALEQDGKSLQGVALVVCPEQTIAALYACREEVEHIIAEHFMVEHVVCEVLLAEHEGTHVVLCSNGMAEVLAQAESGVCAEDGRGMKVLGKDDVLMERGACELYAAFYQKYDVAAGIVLLRYDLSLVKGTEVYFYLA